MKKRLTNTPRQMKMLFSGENKKTIRKILQHIRSYKGWMILSVILAAVTVVLSLYIPILVGRAIDLVLGKGKVDFDGMIPILVQIAIVAVITAVLQWIMNTINNRVTYAVVRDVRDQSFEKIQRLPLKYLDGHAYGEIVSRVITDVDQFADGLLMGFNQLFTGVTTIVVTLIFMLTIHPLVTLVVVVLTPLSLLVARFIATRTYNMFRLQSDTRAEQTALVNEMVSNQKVVRAFAHEEENLRRFDEINDRLEDCSLKATFFSSLTNPCTRFVNSVVYAMVALSGALLVIHGGMTVGGLTCFLSYANQYTKPFNEISGVITELQNALACAARVFALIEEEEEPAENDLEPEKAAGKVELSGVDFSYEPGQRLIEGLNLNVKPGQRIAIVGPTGCGKTTLINLLMRFYDVQQGRITVDDLDIRQITRHSLRSRYGMVLQETWLRSGTIRDNLKMGRPDATDTEMIEAAKVCHADEFIRQLPEGYDTAIGEEGGSLSQGQKQLLCITRVMLCRPAMLILDEATSSIDTRTELYIQDAFARLMEGRTSFIVAHRLSTIRDADVILVMQDGRIVEQGSHEELLKRKGAYERLYVSQFPV